MPEKKAALVHEQVNNAGAEDTSDAGKKASRAVFDQVTAGGLVLSVRCAAGLY